LNHTKEILAIDEQVKCLLLTTRTEAKN
jgi:hypothetical protein